MQQILYGKNVSNVKDKDSNPANLVVPTEIQKPYYLGRNGNYAGMPYYFGQQDDDDFEKVVVAYTDIKGNVTKDTPNGKQKAEGVKVKLTDTTTGGEDITKTDENGDYKFKNKEVNKNYIIEFEYDGQTYIKSLQTKSYVNEDANERQAVNKRFYEITKDGARNKENASSIVTFNYNTKERNIRNKQNNSTI